MIKGKLGRKGKVIKYKIDDWHESFVSIEFNYDGQSFADIHIHLVGNTLYVETRKIGDAPITLEIPFGKGEQA